MKKYARWYILSRRERDYATAPWKGNGTLKILNYWGGGWASNCYLVIDGTGNHAVLIDPSSSPEKISERLADGGITLDAILLTHGHFDHMLTLDEVRAKTGAPVMLGRRDGDCLTDASRSMFLRFNGTDTVFAPADRLLDDGDEIPFGDCVIRVLATPGHSGGSVCYVVGEAIFSGDTLFEGDIGRYDFPDSSYAELRASLARLSALDGDYRIYPGHGNATRLSTEKQENIYMTR